MPVASWDGRRSIGAWRARPGVSLLVALAGYGLAFWAWSLIGPFGVAPQLWSSLHGDRALIAAVAALTVGSLGRIPVGVLTDRYGARIVVPIIDVLTAVSVLLVAAVDRGPALLALAALLGLAGTTFAAGAAAVIRSSPSDRRGFRLSVFGAGMGLASAATALSHLWVTVDRRTALPLLAVALLGHAGLAAAIIRDRPAAPRPPHGARQAVLAVMRLPATRYLSTWYAVAFGGLVTVGLYLPAYLDHTHDVSAPAAHLYTAGCITIAAVCRPLGGRLCQRHDPIAVLRAGFGVTAAVVLALAFDPGLPAVAAVIGTGAVCLGITSGTVQALLGATAPPRQAGTIAGTVGAAGGLAGVLPPLLLAGTQGVTGSYSIGLTMLAAATAAAAWRLHRQRRWLVAAVAFPDPAPPRLIATAVVVTPRPCHSSDLTHTVGVLTAMAAEHELVVVADPQAAVADLVHALRLHLARHRIIAIATGGLLHPHETQLVAQLLNDGAVPVIQPTGAGADQVGLLIAAALGTSHILHIPVHPATTPPGSPALAPIADATGDDAVARRGSPDQAPR